MKTAKPFQKALVERIAAHFTVAHAAYEAPDADSVALRKDMGAVLLEAPTGVGKTFMATRAISQFSRHKKLLWFWFSPWAHLTDQTEAALKEDAAGLTVTPLADERHTDALTGSKVYPLVWASLAAKDETRRKTRDADDGKQDLATFVAEARSLGYRIGVVIDEAHHGMKSNTEASRLLRDVLQPDYHLFVTATPDDKELAEFQHYMGLKRIKREVATRADGVAAGLIKPDVKVFYFKESDESAGYLSAGVSLTSAAIAKAVDQHNRLKVELDNCVPGGLTPLLLVQVSSSSTEAELDAKKALLAAGIAEAGIRIHTAAKPDRNLQQIANDQSVEALIFKMAVGTGFDAPRAFTLVAAAAPADVGSFQAAFADSKWAYDQVVQCGLNGIEFGCGSQGTDPRISSGEGGLVYGASGGVLLTGGAGSDMLVGGAGDDIIDGGSGTDSLYGGAGNDVLGGTDNAERLGTTPLYESYPYEAITLGNYYEGGLGNDTLNGTYGSDVYYFYPGDGSDTIIEMGLTPSVYTGGAGPLDQGYDILRFEGGISPSDVSISRNGEDVIFSLVTGDRVTVKNWLSDTTSGRKLAAVYFAADNSRWTTEDITAAALRVQGTEGDDNLIGVAGFSNTLLGGMGNDSLRGGSLADNLDGGVGNDQLYGGAGSDLLQGDAGNDVLLGEDGDDTLVGGDGDDVLQGGYGINLLQGGAGMDGLGAASYGSASANPNGDPWYYLSEAPKFTGNTYEGGAGSDILNGTYGSDTYKFNLGDGMDAIYELGLSPASAATRGHGVADQGDDVLVFGEGINPADVSVTHIGNDVVFTLANGTDKVTVKGWLADTSSGKKLAAAQFADGTTWSTSDITLKAMSLRGTEGNDTLSAWAPTFSCLLDGGGGNDMLTGSDLADTLIGGDGDDTLNGGAGSDLLQGGAGNDVLGGTSSAERYGAVSSNPGGDPWHTSTVAPKFTGNTYEGGTGNDTLNGTYGSDTYKFNLGDGADTIIEMALSPRVTGTPPSRHPVTDQGDDVLVFGEGINPADVTVTRLGNNVVFTLANGTDKVTVKDWLADTTSGKKLATIQFADGTTWSTDDVTQKALSQHGGAGDDNLIPLTGMAAWANSLFGNGGNDSLTGGTANDLLEGGLGDDNLFGALGNDVYRWAMGDGLDTVTDTGGLADVADFSGITVAMAQFFKGDTGSDLTINVGDSASGMIFKNQLLVGGQPVEQFKFADATLTAAEVQSMAILKV